MHGDKFRSKPTIFDTENCYYFVIFTINDSNFHENKV